VVPSTENLERYLVRFSEYAQVNIPNVWKNDRKPGIDPSKLKWQPMPEPSRHLMLPVATAPQVVVASLTMAEAKRGLVLTFGVAPEAIEITIRG
jgi:hypothetical protein